MTDDEPDEEDGLVGWPRPWRSVASAAFGVSSKLRSRAYDAGWLAAQKVPGPVISVGNLTVGGSGKTPFVVLLVELLESWGHRPAVVSRGYRRQGSGQVVVSSDGIAKVGPQASGDEPALIARKTSAIVVVDEDRVRGARRALELGANVVVLDDGFSHRRLARDLDIVMLDALRPFANRLLLPEGPLRESPAAIRRADLVVINRTVEADAPALDDVPEDLPRVEVVVVPTGLTAGLDGPRTPIMSLMGTSVGLLSAIARPARFRRTLEGLGAKVVHESRHPDHTVLTAEMVERFVQEARIRGAERLVTTEKDAARGTELGPLEVLAIKHRIVGGEFVLHNALRQVMGDP